MYLIAYSSVLEVNNRFLGNGKSVDVICFSGNGKLSQTLRDSAPFKSFFSTIEYVVSFPDSAKNGESLWAFHTWHAVHPGKSHTIRLKGLPPSRIAEFG